MHLGILRELFETWNKITTDAEESFAQMQMTNFASQNQVQMQPMFKTGLSDVSDMQSMNHNQERSDNAFYSVQVSIITLSAVD